MKENFQCKRGEELNLINSYFCKYPVGGYDTQISNIITEKDKVFVVFERQESCD